LGKISVVDFSVLKPDAYARLADDFAKALVEVQDAKEIAPATGTSYCNTSWDNRLVEAAVILPSVQLRHAITWLYFGKAGWLVVS
jgi:hypothetical protein